jgi:hypothetical protein
MKTKLKLIVAWMIFILVSFFLIVLDLFYSLGYKISQWFADIYIWADCIIEEDNRKENKRSLWGDKE